MDPHPNSHGHTQGTLLDIVCCIPREHDGDDERDERLLGGEEGGQEDGEQQDEGDDDPVGKGYLPPAVSKALRAMAGEKRQKDGTLDQEGSKSCTGELQLPQGAAGGGATARRAVGGSPAKEPVADGEEGGEEGRVEEETEAGDVQDGEREEVVDGVDDEGGAVRSRGGGEGEEEEEKEAESPEHHEDPDDGEEKIGISIDYFCCKKCKRRAIETVSLAHFSFLAVSLALSPSISLALSLARFLAPSLPVFPSLARARTLSLSLSMSVSLALSIN